MDYLESFIENINSLTYNNQCEYIKNKLLLLDLYEIQYIMFFKKLHVLFNELLSHISKISRDNKRYICNIGGVLGDKDGYFTITRACVHINYIILTDNVYSVKIPINCIYKLILILI